jgi:hypothetical protein
MRHFNEAPLLLFPQTFKQSLEHTMITLSLKGKDLKSFPVESKHGEEATVGFNQRGGNRKVNPISKILSQWGERTNNMRRWKLTLPLCSLSYGIWTRFLGRTKKTCLVERWPESNPWKHSYSVAREIFLSKPLDWANKQKYLEKNKVSAAPKSKGRAGHGQWEGKKEPLPPKDL